MLARDDAALPLVVVTASHAKHIIERFLEKMMNASWSDNGPKPPALALAAVYVFEARLERLLAQTARAWGLKDVNPVTRPAAAGHPPAATSRTQ